MTKKDENKVRLWLNQITPDNYTKKESELRGLLFGDRKIKDEAGFDPNAAYFVDEQKNSIVVQTLFRKAQEEHIYAGFYATLCTQIIKLELQINNLAATYANIKKSNFYVQLLTSCRDQFEKLLHQKSESEVAKDD